MYSYALLGKSHDLWTYRLIFLIIDVIASSLCLLHFITSILAFIIGSYISYFIHLEWWFFIYLCIKGNHTTPFIPSFGIDSEILAQGLSHRMGFHVFINDLRKLVHSLYFSHWSSIYWWPGYVHTKKKKSSDMFVFDILLHWACVATWALFIGFIIEGLYEFSMRTLSLLEPFSLCS